MTALLLSLLCVWPTSPAPRADCYALITAQEQDWPVVIGNGFVIRADPAIGHIAGKPWSDIRRQCAALSWPIWQVSIPQKPAFRARLR